MKRILITGMSGTGKSAVTEALAALGHRAVDLDDPAWSEYRAVPDGHGDEAVEWVWRDARVAALLAGEGREALFVSGCASNMARFYPRFDDIVLLSAPGEVLLERLESRTSNSYGKRPEEVAEVLRNLAEVEPLLRGVATLEVDTRAPLDDVVERIARLAEGAPP